MATAAQTSSKAGFSLTEVLVASMIFLIVSVGFTGGMIAALKTHSMAVDHYRCSSLARNRIQRAKTVDFDSVQTLSETYVPVDPEGNVTYGSAGIYRRTTVVTNLDAHTLDITVDVFFPAPYSALSDRPAQVRTRVFRGM